MRRPTLLGFSVLSLFVIPQASAQDAPAPDSTRPAFTASSYIAPLPVPAHPALAPGGRLGPRRPAALVAAEWERRVRASRTRVLTWTPGVGPDTATVAVGTPAAPAAPTAPDRVVNPASLFGLGPYADIGMQLNLRFELKADQFRNLRCTSQEQLLALSGCHPGFPTITPNPQYSIRTSGVVGQRLHINVDFDSQREFDANNNLQVWYEGLEDEMLRRVEAGNVTFQASPSRFISAAIPANNFGVQAIGQVGALEFRGIYAQQKGNVIKDRVYTVGETTTQPVDRETRDLDFESGRFFFTVDPAALPGYPAVDILGIESQSLPDSLRVGDLQVYRVRAITTGSTNLNVGGIRATACGASAVQAVDCSAATGQRAGPYQWEILTRGVDYYVDPSGTWFALANRLAQDDYLAVSYATAALDSVGTLPVISSEDTTRIDTLRLVYAPNPGLTASAPSFRFEFRGAYRVGGSEISRQTVELALTVNQRERTVATGQTYLAFLGLAVSTDPSRFDEYNRLFPRARDPQQGHPVRDNFVIFPHLQPFADVRLDPTERNDSLYRTPRSQLQAYGPPSVFALRVHASVSASADRGTLSLNSFQIREGSERLYLRTTLLTRGVDYTIDYSTGQVQFTNPDSLFQGGAAQVRAQFEERAAFAIAPTSIYGVAARYDLGLRGTVNFTGLFQQEQSAFNRPPLGFEPSSSFIGGVSTELRFQPEWLTRVVDALPGVQADAPSFVNVSAEIALSRPTPNRLGQAYLEEFETEAGRFLALGENTWRWGSLPSSPRGAEPFGVLSTGFDVLNAAALTWQSLPINPGGGQVVFFSQQIDPTIRTAGQAQSAEPVLWLMLKPDTALGLAHNKPDPNDPLNGVPNWVRPAQNAPRWRSITQSISATGIDLSRVEFLEFWVWEDAQRLARAGRTTLLIDIGAVFEDAVAFVPNAFKVVSGDTTYYGARLAGPGRLDSERDPITHTWNAHEDDIGFLTDFVTDGIYDSTADTLVNSLPLCSATVDGQVVGYGFGDLRSRCGRQNGAIDSEDQDGDFALDQATGVRTQEDFVRFVFPIGDERYFVRDGGSIQGATWRLYRIPFRTDSLQVGLPNLRQVQAIRLTVVAPQTGPPSLPDSQVYFALSRVRFVGSSWLKRADTPVRGIAGERGTGSGEVAASVVSTENRDLGYTPPPGVFDQADRRDAGLQLGTTQINERSMRVLARGLQIGERAEAFLRFTSEGDKNFLRYRRLRVWARGRGPGWEDGDLEFFIKVGKDPDNFYFYRTPARTSSWEPEVVIDFDRWLVLRAQVEQAYLRGDTAGIGPGCPDTTLVPFDSAYVRCDGPYIVHVRHPGTAPPNLAQVQEMAAGILRVNDRVFADPAEVWVDDIRLSDVVQDVGLASALDVSLSAAGVADLAVSLSRRDGNFRQLGDDPSYSTDNTAAVGGSVRLDRFLPVTWGISAPLSVRYATTASDPFYLNRTDLRADVLQGLRTPQSDAVSYSFSLRRTRRAQAALVRWLVDPIALSGSYTAGSSRSDFARATSSSYGVNADYTLNPTARIARIAGLRVRLNPSGIRFRSGLTGTEASRRNFQVPVARPLDSLVVPVVSQGRQWRNNGSVDLLPVPGLQVRADLASLRDLRDYGDSTTMGRLVRGARRTLLGLDVGLETQRTVNTLVSLTPQTSGWLRPRVTVSSSFNMSRDPNAREPARETGDTAGAFAVPAAFSNSWRFDAGANLDPRALGRALFGDSARMTAVLQRLSNLDISLGRVRSSTYNRTALDPALGYQLGWGGFDSFRSQGGILAAAAVENNTFQTGGTLRLPLGLRANSSYRRTSGVTWALRSEQQVPIRTRSLEWPAGGINWSWTSPRRGFIGRALTSFTVNLSYRRSRTGTVQPPLGGVGGASVAEATTRSLSPTLTVVWRRGVLTSFDATADRSEQLTAGNLFRSVRGNQNATLSFSFKPPASLARLKTSIRTTARFSTSDNTTCLQQAGQPLCKAYVDSRQTQMQLTMDTDFPPNMSAGLQMAYLINEERQASRKIAQLVITAFVNLTTTVGQLR